MPQTPPSSIAWGPPDRGVGGAPYHITHVDAEPYRRVIAEAHRHHPMRVIADATGISRYRLTQIESGRVWRIRTDTARRLRAGLPALLPSETAVDGS